MLLSSSFRACSSKVRLGRLAPALLLAGSLFATDAAQAQAVPRAVLAEHFTNTVCSICASRNPGFYANLRRQAAPVLHVAYHPSSPYRACVFSQQNPAENDARTNFYGVYGGTPRLVLNGSVVPAGQDYAAAVLFAPFQGQISPFAVAVALQAVGADSIAVVVRIETRAAHSYAALQLYLPLAEDTVFYAAPNGEQRHYDVFRKSFSGPQPLAFGPAPAVGGSVTVRRVLAKSPAWVPRRLYALAVVQDAANQVLQAAASARLGSAAPLAATQPAAAGALLFPNPVREMLFVSADAARPVAGWQVLNALGRRVLGGGPGPLPTALDVRGLAAGVYALRVQPVAGRPYGQRFVKE